MAHAEDLSRAPCDPAPRSLLGAPRSWVPGWIRGDRFLGAGTGSRLARQAWFGPGRSCCALGASSPCSPRLWSASRSRRRRARTFPSSRPRAGALSDGASQFETCTSTCQAGIGGGGAGEFDNPYGVATDSSGDVYVADAVNERIDEFSAAGAFIKAYGWGVIDGASQFETCTTTCQAGIAGRRRRAVLRPRGVATDSSGDVYVADTGDSRIDEFSAAGAFIKAYGWGVSDGASQFETCTTTCQAGIPGSGAGQFYGPAGVATDSSGDVYVADEDNNRIDEFSAAGAFIKAYGWGVLDGASQFETCTTTCQAGIAGGGAGQLDDPQASPPIPRATSTSPTTATTGSMSSPPPARSSRPTAGALPTAPASLRPAPPPARPGSRAAAPGSSSAPGASPPIARATSTSPIRGTSGSTSSPPPARSSRPTAGALSTAPASLRPAPPPARPGSLATAPGQLDNPADVATDTSGDVYVADSTGSTSSAPAGHRRPPPRRVCRVAVSLGRASRCRRTRR